MNPPELALAPEKKDYLVALVLAVLALAVYVRTLAPDILYADSAEFQCLSYTLGITHSTGYPTYLLLGRLIGFLPIHSPAWRINLLSAVCAAATVSGGHVASVARRPAASTSRPPRPCRRLSPSCVASGSNSSWRFPCATLASSGARAAR